MLLLYVIIIILICILILYTGFQLRMVGGAPRLDIVNLIDINPRGNEMKPDTHFALLFKSVGANYSITKWYHNGIEFDAIPSAQIQRAVNMNPPHLTPSLRKHIIETLQSLGRNTDEQSIRQYSVDEMIYKITNKVKRYNPDVYTLIPQSYSSVGYALFVEFDEGEDFHSSPDANYIKKYLVYNNMLTNGYRVIQGSARWPIVVRTTYPNGMHTADKNALYDATNINDPNHPNNPNVSITLNFTGWIDRATRALLELVLNNIASFKNCYVLCKFGKFNEHTYTAKIISSDHISADNAKTVERMYYEPSHYTDRSVSLPVVGGGTVAVSNDFSSRFKEPYMEVDTQYNTNNGEPWNANKNEPWNANKNEPWDPDAVAKKLGLITLEGVEGCANARYVDLLNPAYNDDTRFTKALDFYVSGMSNCYANCVHGEETSIFHILSKMAPKATNLYNYDYGVNIADLYCEDVEKIEEMGGIENLDELVKIKREYVEKVFGDSTFNEYDKRFAVNVVLSEFVMWSEYYEDYIKRTISPYFVKFFEEHKEYIAENSIDWKEWNEKHVPNKSRWMDE